MAEKPAKKKSSQSKSKAAAKKSSTAKKKPAANNKKSAKEEWEYQRKRFFIAIVQFLISALLLFVFFLSGENLWNSVHKLYVGLFGIFGLFIPGVLVFCAYQNIQDEPTYHFKLKTFMLSLSIFLLSTSICCFSGDNIAYDQYLTGLGTCAEYAVNNIFAPGILGGLLGIPLINLFGSVGGGLISGAAFLISLFFTLDMLLSNFVDTIRKPAQNLNEHISDKRTIRQEVRRRQQEIREEEHQKEREEYIKQQVEKKMKKKVPDDGLTKIKNTPFYTPQGQEKQGTDSSAVKPKKKKTENVPEEINYIIPPITEIPAAPPATPPALLQADTSIPVPAVKKPLPEQPKSKSAVNEPASKPAAQQEKSIEPAANSFISGNYIKPPFTLLEPQPPEDEHNISLELNQLGQSLVETLKSFGVQTSIVNICKGPSVTRFELQPASGVKISKITHLADDIAMNLAAMGVRIEAPIPGKNAVGIEVPNKTVSLVKMRELVESKEFQNSKSNLTVVLGKDITGKITLADLSKMPHLLIAGSTGSGKSVCINSMIVSLLYKASPDDVKLLLIDPKVVELGVYNGIPHLLVPVVTDPRKAAGALNWAVNEMLNRYKTFAEFNVRDIHGYNRFVDKQNLQNEVYENDEAPLNDNERTFEEDEMLAQAQSELNENDTEETEEKKEPVKLKKMPQIVIIIDELADLMMAASKEVEESICRLAQMARAAGMHLVIATQRPSVDIITGLIKANVPSRIAFAVKTVTDSRTILDMGGADKLLGKGDMLYSPIGITKPVRIQGCFVDDTEVENIIDFIKKSEVVEYDKDVIDEIERNALPENTAGGEDADGDLDPMMEEAIKCVVEAGQASTSMLQRRFRLGYARAGRLIDEMEQLGIVGPHEGAKPRKVLMTYQQWLERSVSGNNED